MAAFFLKHLEASSSCNRLGISAYGILFFEETVRSSVGGGEALKKSGVQGVMRFLPLDEGASESDAMAAFFLKHLEQD